MDINFVFGSFELPSDQPQWEAALLEELSRAPPVAGSFQGLVRSPEPEPERCTATLLVTRPTAT